MKSNKIITYIDSTSEKCFRGKNLYAVLIILFLFRLWVGFNNKFWSPDELQVYLIGLKSYTTGLWPFWGADVVYTDSRIVGALQGLIISLPLKLWAAPESPIVLLNIINFVSLFLFGKYLLTVIDSLPKWFVWLFLFTCPWTMEFSTHIVNPSYILPGAVLFFIGFFDSTQFFEKRLFPANLSFFLMGFSIGWLMQFHMSWVLFGPYIAFAFFKKETKLNDLVKKGLFTVLGFALTASLIIPTLLYHPETFAGGSEKNIIFNFHNLLEPLTILVRFLSFSTLEVSRFFSQIQNLFDHLNHNPAIIPFAIILTLSSVFCIGLIIWRLFIKNTTRQLIKTRRLLLASVIILYFSFLFSIKGPKGYTFYALFPVSVVIGFSVYQNLFRSQFIRAITILLLLLNIIYSISVTNNFYHKHSLYNNRQDMVSAIANKEYTRAGGFRRTASFEERDYYIWQYSYDSITRKKQITSDFEFENPVTRIQNVSANKSKSGSFSNVIHNKSPFSVSYIASSDEITGKCITMTADIYGSNQDTLLWVLSIEDSISGNDWHAEKIILQEKNSWNSINKEYKFKAIDSTAILKTFIWKPSDYHDTFYYIDNLQYTLLPTE